MNKAITNQVEDMEQNVENQMTPAPIPPLPQPAPQPAPQDLAQYTMSSGRPVPGMDPFSNGTGSGRPNISQMDANNLNQFKQGVSMNKNYGYGASKKEGKLPKNQTDPSAYFTIKPSK
tara:strand:+ start:341 stop:694 length:354 start_codon:yes stop_codon:yes gene_type:complete